MISLVDELYLGNLGSEYVNFNNTHFLKRLRDNKISLDFVKNLIFNEEILDYRPSNDHGPDSYELIYPAPESKDYLNVKVCVKVYNGCINLVTIMDDGQTSSKSRKNSTKSKKKRNEDALICKAYKKRRHP